MERERRSSEWTWEQMATLAGRYWRHLGGWSGFLLRLGFLTLTWLAIGLHVPAASSMLGVGLALLSVVLAATAALPLAVYATVWAVFTVLRAGADDLGSPDWGQTIAAIDRWLGNGVMPGKWLQRTLHTSAMGGAIDAAATVVHLSYFVMPHLVAVGFWWLAFSGRSDRFFRSYVIGIAAVMALGMLGFMLLPTSPPWLMEAGQGAEIEIERIAGSQQREADSNAIYLVRDPNPVAAFPSLHQAITLVMAGALWWYDRRLGLLGIAYCLAMGFALVYLGEHYLVDILAGWALGAVVVAVIDRWHPARARTR